MNERKRLCLATDGRIGGLAIAVIAISLLVAGDVSAKGRNQYRPCKDTAEKMYQSCKAEVLEESKVGAANCINLATREERAECRSEVSESKNEARGTCREQREGRGDALQNLGE